MERKPFLVVNPKSYLYGKASLELALASDKVAKDTGLTVFFTCPYADLRMIKENTQHIIVTAQSMDPLSPGRGMGHVLGESLKEAGAGAVFLNHAENPKTLSDLYKTIQHAKELGLITVVCADSVTEAKAVACMKPDIVLAEPTDLIGHDCLWCKYCPRLLQCRKTWCRWYRCYFRYFKSTRSKSTCSPNGRSHCESLERKIVLAKILPYNDF